jgi:hypothetical protein
MTEPLVGFRLTRWLYGLCWTGTERPSKLFERATAWLLAHKILLPGCSTQRLAMILGDALAGIIQPAQVAHGKPVASVGGTLEPLEGSGAKFLKCMFLLGE